MAKIRQKNNGCQPIDTNPLLMMCFRKKYSLPDPLLNEDLKTVVGYTAIWFPETDEVQIELNFLNSSRKSLGKMDSNKAAPLLNLLSKNGKKSISYMEDQYMQVSEYYKFR